jgi:hypothetical protein
MIWRIAFGQENVTRFQIGIGIDAMDFTANETCSNLENEFIQKIMEKYTIALARIYFRMDCIEMENPMQPVDASQFHPLAFEDYNLYMATKYVLPATISPLGFPEHENISEHSFPIIATTGEVLESTQALVSDEATPSITPFISPSNQPTVQPVVFSNNTTSRTSPESLLTLPPTTTVTTAPTILPFTNRPTPISAVPLQTSSLPTTIVPTLSSTSMPTCSSQRLCAVLNFERFPNGTAVPRGAYVATEWYRVYGLNISVFPYGISWYAPFKPGTNLRQARIFNSSNPGVEPDGDDDLGSPNQLCTRPGPGKGDGGVPGAKGENCYAHENILIIQESNKASPDDALYGGTFDFSFRQPVYFENLGLLGISQGFGSIKAILQNGTSKTFRYENLGKNSYQTINILTSKVQKLQVYLPQAGAITHLKFCNASCDGILRRVLSESSKPFESQEIVSEVVSRNDYNEMEESRNQRHLQTQTFRWGGSNNMICRGCSGDTADARRLSPSALDTFLNSSLFLLPAFESVISVGLTVDLRWEYNTWLANQKESVGCLGNGRNATVVFEMLASRK